MRLEACINLYAIHVLFLGSNQLHTHSASKVLYRATNQTTEQANRAKGEAQVDVLWSVLVIPAHGMHS